MSDVNFGDESFSQFGNEQGTAEKDILPDASLLQKGEQSEGEAEATEVVDANEAQTAQELVEHNALARVFDDVRTCSMYSLLAQPKRWAEIGLVPDHLSVEEFEMLVYEYLEEDRAERGRLPIEQEPAPVFRTATRTVGVPTMFRKDEPERAEEADTAGELEGENNSEQMLAAAGAVEDGALEGAVSAVEATDQGVVEQVSNTELPGDLDADNPFAGLNMPEGFELVELEGEYVLVPSEEEVAPVELAIECENIAVLTGAQGYYLYDRNFMTDAYAHWAFLAAEDNRVVTFVDCVREDSRVYPRPLAATSLENPPFSMTADEVAETWEAVQGLGDYPDLGKTVASNGDVYYYSTDYLSHTYAASLAEWDAVERKMNY